MSSTATLESPLDLLGGFTKVMSHFQVDHPQATLPISATASQLPVTSASDLLAVLSEAFRKAMASEKSPSQDTNADKTLEARHNDEYLTNSLVWAGDPSLLSLLSKTVDQVCVIDSGAAAKLLDTILGATSFANIDITSIVTSITGHLSVSTAEALPLILPALATALGAPVQQPVIADRQDINGIMAKIVFHGGQFVSEIINSETYLATTELHDCLNQLAGLMCAAAGHLMLPLCTVSKQILSTTYRIIIPCNCANADSPAAATQNPAEYTAEQSRSATRWSVMTMPPSTGYSVPSFSISNLPPQYEKTAPGVSASASLSQSQSQQVQTSCRSTLPPAYSGLYFISTKLYDEG